MYLQIKRGKQYANSSMAQYTTVDPATLPIPHKQTNHSIGPLWMGSLHNLQAVKEIRTLLFSKDYNTKQHLWNLLSLVEEETSAAPFHYTTDDFASYLHMSPPPRELVFTALQTQGYNITKTQFSPTGFTTNAPLKVVKEVFKKANP